MTQPKELLVVDWHWAEPYPWKCPVARTREHEDCKTHSFVSWRSINTLHLLYYNNFWGRFSLWTSDFLRLFKRARTPRVWKWIHGARSLQQLSSVVCLGMPSDEGDEVQPQVTKDEEVDRYTKLHLIYCIASSVSLLFSFPRNKNPLDWRGEAFINAGEGNRKNKCTQIGGTEYRGSLSNMCLHGALFREDLIMRKEWTGRIDLPKTIDI